MEIIHFLDDLNQPYSCNAWGEAFSIGIPPIVDDGTINTIFNWFNNPNGSGIYPLIIFLDHTMEIVNIMGSSPSLNVSNIIIEAMLDAIPVDIEGCIDESACNYNPNANSDDGSCTYLEIDCSGVCGGPALDDECGICIDPVCNSSGTPSPFTAGKNPCQLEGEYPISTLWNSTCDLSLLSNKILPPNHFKINNLYPNPFNPVLNIDFEISQAGWVKVNITDITGSMVETIYAGYKGVGIHQISWTSDLLPTGTYFVTLELNEFLKTKKVVFLK